MLDVEDRWIKEFFSHFLVNIPLNSLIYNIWLDHLEYAELQELVVFLADVEIIRRDLIRVKLLTHVQLFPLIFIFRECFGYTFKLYVLFS